MKNRLVTGFGILIGLLLVSGCSSKIGSFDISNLNPFKEKVETVAENTYKEPEVTNTLSGQELAAEIDRRVNEVVATLLTGNWDKAIKAGEEAYVLAVNEAAYPADGSSNQVYGSPGLNSTKEKLYEVLVDAYDYKNHLEGLSKEETEKYVRTQRDHFNLNPAEPFKKLALARTLIETGNLIEGNKLAQELFNSEIKHNEITDTYAWGLYQSGKKLEAYNIYRNFWAQTKTLVHLYHSAFVIEEYDKQLGFALYRAAEKAGNNLMVFEPNIDNLSVQSYIAKIIRDSQNNADRLLVGGVGLDNHFNVNELDALVGSIAQL